MLFSEVYGTYYNVLARLLTAATEGTLTKELLTDTVRRHGFEESILTIPEALESEVWPLLKADLTTPLTHRPTMPLTNLQKRWLKTLLQDPRIRLFDPPTKGLEDVQPLYPADAFVFFDRYTDGDPFEDPQYIARFRIVLAAIREKRSVRIGFYSGNGKYHRWICTPTKLEYSSKDDKFRMICADERRPYSINLARIRWCDIVDEESDTACKPAPMEKCCLVLELIDQRNALERAMLHFSHLEKETERIEGDRYRLTLYFEKEDETELLIRVLSFGPMLKAVAPQAFVEKLKLRLQKQKNMV